MATSKKPVVKVNDRKKKLPSYRSFRLSKSFNPSDYKKLPRARLLLADSIKFMWKYKLKMLGILVVYTIFYGVFVRGSTGFESGIADIKSEILNFSDGKMEAFFQIVYLYNTLLSSLTLKSEASNTTLYQFIIIVLTSLAFIWLIRKLHARDSEATVRQAFYVGMGPLIPFVLVLGILIIEMLPFGLGAFIVSTAVSSGSIQSGGDSIVMAVMFILLFVLSAYLLAGSVFSLYIVTLPGTTPISAVRTSMKLLRLHRWRVVARIISFFLILILAGFILVLPFIIWVPRYAEIAFFIMGSLSFGIMHVYMYKLYKSML